MMRIGGAASTRLCRRSIGPPPAISRASWLLGFGDLATHDRLDRVVVETAADEIRVDLPPLLRVRHVRPARERSREGALRLLDVGIRRPLAEDQIDDVTRDALLR